MIFNYNIKINSKIVRFYSPSLHDKTTKGLQAKQSGRLKLITFRMQKLHTISCLQLQT